MQDWTIAALLEVASVACTLHLWAKAKGTAGHKLSWTPVVLVPVIGPLFYGGLYDAAPVDSDDVPDATDVDEDVFDATAFRQPED